MELNDVINSGFVFVAGFFYILNLYKLYADKDVKGISKLSIVFFSCWNFWTLYFFLSSTDFFWSQLSYGFVAIVNAAYLAMLAKYTFNKKKVDPPPTS